MSSMFRVATPGAGRGTLFVDGEARPRDRSLGYFTSRRSAVWSMVALATIVLLLVLDLAGPLFG